MSVGLSGLEPDTPDLWGRRSNQRWAKGPNWTNCLCPIENTNIWEFFDIVQIFFKKTLGYFYHKLYMSTIFYLFSTLFIWVEIFQMRNRMRIDYIDVQSLNPKRWIFFYISKIVYYFWMILGLFTDNPYLFSILIILGLLKFLIVKTGKDLYINLYDLISCVLSIIILLEFTFLGVVLLL